LVKKSLYLPTTLLQTCQGSEDWHSDAGTKLCQLVGILRCEQGGFSAAKTAKQRKMTSTAATTAVSLTTLGWNNQRELVSKFEFESTLEELMFFNQQNSF